MKQRLVIMLTDNDVTVANAKEVFLAAKHLPVEHWGFKDVGLPFEQMVDLVNTMKAHGKTTNLEIVSLSEEESLAGAKIAVDTGFDILMGTAYKPSIKKFLEGTGVMYYPFCGNVYGHPSVLDGTIDEIVAHAKFLEAEGADGIDLLSFRYVGDAMKLLRAVVEAVKIPVISAGSVNSFRRIDEVAATGAEGMTMGTALFHEKFVKGDFVENLRSVVAYLGE